MNAHQLAHLLISDAEDAGVKVRRSRQEGFANLWVPDSQGMPIMTATIEDHPAAGESAIKINARSLDDKPGQAGSTFTWASKSGDLNASVDVARTVWNELCSAAAAANHLSAGTQQTRVSTVDIEIDIEPEHQALKVDTESLAARARGALLSMFAPKRSAASHLKP